MGKAFSLICPETTLLVNEEIRLFALSFLLGVAVCNYICIKYSLLKFCRAGKKLIFLCDIVSSCVVSASVFVFSLKFNFGIIRLYMLVSASAGVFLFGKFFYRSLQKMIFKAFMPLKAIVCIFVDFKRKCRKFGI